MADNTMVIEIEAKASQAVKTIEGVNKSLATMPAAANKAGAAIDKVNKASASAIPTLTNFGRVVQDAPFGLIGIANNIDPLVSSFTALKASTGTTGGALKALAGSLMGPAGIAIGVSAVTSLLIAFGDKLFGASKEATALNKALTDAAGTASKELVDFAALVGFAQDHTKSLSERKKAVDALQKEYPAYLKNVSDEAILTGKATEAINKSIDAILRQATIKLLKDEIAKSVEETAKQIIAIEKAVAVTKAKAAEDKNATEKQKNLTDATKDFNNAAMQSLQSGRGMREATKEVSEALDAASFAQANRPEDKIKRLKDELFKSIAPILQLAEGAGDLDANLDKAGKSAKSMSDFVTNLRTELNALQGTKEGSPFAKIDAEAQKALTTLARFKKEGKLSAQDIIDAPGVIAEIQKIKTEFEANKLFQDAQKVSAEKSAEMWALVYREALKKELSKIVPAVPDMTAEELKASLQQTLGPIIGDSLKKAQDAVAQLNALAASAAASVASSIGEGIGNLVSGMADPFAAFFQALAAAMKQFGEAIIGIAVAKMGLDKLFKAGPAGGPLALAAGVGLVALSSIVKNFKGPKFAEGGIVNGPTLAMVGDNPGRKEAIIPIEKWDMLNGGGDPVVLTTRISGRDLLLVQERASGSFRRTNG